MKVGPIREAVSNELAVPTELDKNDIQVYFCETDALSVKLVNFWTPLARPLSVENQLQYQHCTTCKSWMKSPRQFP